jgi:hypothetical protein
VHAAVTPATPAARIKSKNEFDKALKLKTPWTLHDLRRTGRRGLGILGVAPHIAEAVLNHLPPRLVRTYDTHDYFDEKRQALDLWAVHLMRLVSGKGGTWCQRCHPTGSSGRGACADGEVSSDPPRDLNRRIVDEFRKHGGRDEG